MRLSPRVGILVAAVTVGISLVSACGESTTSSVADVPFSGADGKVTSVAEFEGKPLVVNMWATYCVPCLKEMPALDEVADEFAGQLNVIGVNVFDTPARAASFARDLDVEYPQFSDPEGALSTALAVTGLPATAFFDASGTLLDVHQGAYTADDLRAAIAAHQFTGSEGTETS